MRSTRFGIQDVLVIPLSHALTLSAPHSSMNVLYFREKSTIQAMSCCTAKRE
ncbi:hypothetical protein SMB34_09535 [Thalassospira permensis NBRC 106175]|uniref:Uncharacterized protein n=1 Tax=Thalassospira permensis NBRC 106175 TaxID=1353532 RepID=A0ABR4TIP6_9PROT|nr:hypothetical protein SMB34_09535 [Thalassospira permensis NBRC 106175]